MILNEYLPLTLEESKKLGWETIDFVLVSGDAYIDHPSFGPTVVARTLLDAGFTVGIISQPDWTDPESVQVFGEPRLGFLVGAGNMDSMVNHYYVSKKKRKKDLYTPGGEMGKRPDRATIVYTNLIRSVYKKKTILIGGIEASLRRFAHYDYWEDKVRKSILEDSGADLLLYGMSEKQIVEIAECLNNGLDIKYIHHVPGTCYLTSDLTEVYEYIEVESYDQVSTSKEAYARAFRVQNKEQDPIRGNVLVQKQNKQFLIQNPPAMPLDQKELDWSFNLGYQRNYHPSYESKGGVPAIQEVKMGIISERGCLGNCSFCAIGFHQGRMITARSHESIIKEAVEITNDRDFKGYIHDVGGPTANFRIPACEKQKKEGVCKAKQCLFPNPCKNLTISHEDYLSLLRKLRALDGVKKVFIRSGIRYDYVMHDPDDTFFRELCEHHVSGQLKIAPEHIDESVLNYMGKPSGDLYQKFVEKFDEINESLGKEQYIVPYLMSSHPGSTLNSAIKLAEFLRDTGYAPEQVQDFYPTPGTMSTCMYYTGIDPRNMKPVYVPTTTREKAMQRALLQYKNPANYDLVSEALILCDRKDLIGSHSKALISEHKKYRHKQKGR